MELVEVVVFFVDLLFNVLVLVVVYYIFYKRFDIVVINVCNFVDYLYIGIFFVI